MNNCVRSVLTHNIDTASVRLHTILFLANTNVNPLQKPVRILQTITLLTWSSTKMFHNGCENKWNGYARLRRVRSGWEDTPCAGLGESSSRHAAQDLGSRKCESFLFERPQTAFHCEATWKYQDKCTWLGHVLRCGNHVTHSHALDVMTRFHDVIFACLFLCLPIKCWHMSFCSTNCQKPVRQIDEGSHDQWVIIK